MINLGLIAIVSHAGRYLEAKQNGQIHASQNEIRNECQWNLWEVDRAARKYAFQNAAYGRYISKSDQNCAYTNRDAIGEWETWTVISGANYGLPHLVALRAYDGTILGANNPGDDTRCGGEVMAAGRPDPATGAGNRTWPGWFYFYAQGVVVPGDGGLDPVPAELLEAYTTPALE